MAKDDMKSCLIDELKIKYQGFTRDIGQGYKRTTIIYQGSFKLCNDALNNEFFINNYSSEYGTIESVRMTQEDGPIWNIEVSYVIDTSGDNSSDSSIGTGTESAAGTSKEAMHSSLNVTMMSVSLESLPHYRKRWNNNLYTTAVLINNTERTLVKEIVASATFEDDKIKGTSFDPIYNKPTSSNDLRLAWAKSESDLPALDTGLKWLPLFYMSMPGVDSIDIPSYELTQYSEHNNKTDAAWAISQKAGCITTPPKGDFGMSKMYGGNWLCLGGTVQNNGKKWIATCTYQWSPDKWDSRIYPFSNYDGKFYYSGNNGLRQYFNTTSYPDIVSYGDNYESAKTTFPKS